MPQFVVFVLKCIIKHNKTRETWGNTPNFVGKPQILAQFWPFSAPGPGTPQGGHPPPGPPPGPQAPCRGGRPPWGPPPPGGAPGGSPGPPDPSPERAPWEVIRPADLPSTS